MKEHNSFKDEKIYYWNHNLDREWTQRVNEENARFIIRVLTEENKNCQESSYI